MSIAYAGKTVIGVSQKINWKNGYATVYLHQTIGRTMEEFAIIYCTRECHKEVHGISVIIHYPKDKEAQQELAKKVADVHAQTVIERLKAMSYPVDQKARLIDTVKSYITQ